MNPPMAIHDARRKRVKLYSRPSGARIERVHQPIFVYQRGDLEILRSLGDGCRSPDIKIGLDGEQLCVRLFEIEFEEVA